MGVHVVWFKRDLRMVDHEPRAQAAQRGPDRAARPRGTAFGAATGSIWPTMGLPARGLDRALRLDGAVRHAPDRAGRHRGRCACRAEDQSRYPNSLVGRAEFPDTNHAKLASSADRPTGTTGRDGGRPRCGKRPIGRRRCSCRSGTGSRRIDLPRTGSRRRRSDRNTDDQGRVDIETELPPTGPYGRPWPAC